MNVKVCDRCRETPLHGPLKRCSRCLAGYYCDLECQKQDWEDHRFTCAQIQRLVACGMTPLTRTADLCKWRHRQDRHLTLGIAHAAYDLCKSYEKISEFDWNSKFVAITVSERSLNAETYKAPPSHWFLLSSLSIMPMRDVSSVLPHVTVIDAQGLLQNEQRRYMSKQTIDSRPTLASVFVALATSDRSSYAFYVEHLLEEPGVSNNMNRVGLYNERMGHDDSWLSTLKCRVSRGHCAIRAQGTSNEAWTLMEEYWDTTASKFKTRALNTTEQLENGYIPMLAGISLYGHYTSIYDIHAYGKKLP